MFMDVLNIIHRSKLLYMIKQMKFLIAIALQKVISVIQEYEPILP